MLTAFGLFAVTAMVVCYALDTVTVPSSSCSHSLVFLALFTASCKVRGRLDLSNWHGRVLQSQSGGQVGDRKPNSEVDERNRDISIVEIL